MYKLVGADRAEYGPVTREAVLEWIAQGRANAQTIAKFEDGPWKPLGTFDEFKAALGVSATPPTIDVWSTSTSAPPPPFSGVGSQTKTNIPAILSIVFPLVCCCCAYVGPALGIIFSIISLSQLRSNPNIYSTSPIVPKIGLGISIAILILHIIGSFFDPQLTRYLEQFRPHF